MSIRREPIYISTEVYRWLWLLAKAKPETDRETINSGRKTMSPDEMADNLLRAHILEFHTNASEGQRELDQLENQIIEKLKKK